MPSSSPFLSPAPVIVVAERPLQGPVIVITDGSQEGAANGWAVVLVEAAGIVAHAGSGGLLWCSLSWVAEWCAKGLALWLLQHMHVAPDTVCGIIADNLAASFGSAGGSLSLCVRCHPPRVCQLSG